jgi:hypothetical protein
MNAVYDIHKSVHLQHIPKIQPTRYYATQFIYFNKNALHVSGGSSAHHQELKLYIQLLVFVKGQLWLEIPWTRAGPGSL